MHSSDLGAVHFRRLRAGMECERLFLRGNRRRGCRGGLYGRPCRRVGCTVAERTRRRGAHGASGTGCDIRWTGGPCTRSWRHVGMPPYAHSGGGNALHPVAGGPMWASAPTRGPKAGPVGAAFISVRACLRFPQAPRFRRCGKGAYTMRPYGETGCGRSHRTQAGSGTRLRAAIQAAPTKCLCLFPGCLYVETAPHIPRCSVT